MNTSHEPQLDPHAELEQAEQLERYIAALQSGQAFIDVPVTADPELLMAAQLAKSLHIYAETTPQVNAVQATTPKINLWQILLPTFGVGITAALIAVVVFTPSDDSAIPAQLHKPSSSSTTKVALNETDRQFVLDTLNEIDTLNAELDSDIASYTESITAVEDLLDSSELDALTADLEESLWVEYLV